MNDKNILAKDIVDLYKSRLNNKNTPNELSNIIPHDDLYNYSVAYQILLDSGNKSKIGVYYIYSKIYCSRHNWEFSWKNKKILESCCGGWFLYNWIYKNKFGAYPNGLIYLNEIDPISAEITKLNIINLTKNQMSDFVVTCCGGLSLNYNDILYIKHYHNI